MTSNTLKEAEPVPAGSEVERRIREVLAAETHSVALSNKLFTPDGLFSLLARTEEERRVVSKSQLFREALARVSELMRQEVDALERKTEQDETGSIVNHVPPSVPSGDV